MEISASCLYVWTESYMIKQRKISIGFNIIGFGRGTVGIAEALRAVARSLEAANIPFCIYNLKNADFTHTEKEFAKNESDEALYPFSLFVLPIHIQRDYLCHIPKSFYKDKYLITLPAWELEKMPTSWKGSLAFFDDVWAFSTFTKKALEHLLHKPIFVVPPAIRKPTFSLSTRKMFGFLPHEYIFLGLFDYLSNAERKNPFATISAFQVAFAKNQPGVRLVLKTNNHNVDNSHAKRLLKQTKGWKNITFINESYTSKKVWSLINAADCVVSLHHSEGFGLTCAEGMLLGKPIIATNWSGNTDFMNKKNSCLVPAKLVNLKKDSAPYRKGDIWADPDVNIAARWMQRLYSDRELGEKIGRKGAQTIRSQLSPFKIGLLIKKYMKRFA